MSNVKVCTGRPRETALSNCRFGCKVMTCPKCGYTFIFHYSVYGHKETWKQPVALI